jgi:hypothetical protein
MLSLPVLAADVAAQAPGPATTAPTPPPPLDTDLAHVTWSSWESDRQHHPLQLEAGPLWWRKRGTPGDATEGFEGSVGAGSLVRVYPFALAATTQVLLRGLDSSSYALSYVQTISAALVLGPLEPDLRASLSLATVDVIHGNWSAELLAPRIGAGAWLRFGPVSLGAHAYGEYLWRWLGNGDVISHGVVFTLALGR